MNGFTSPPMAAFPAQVAVSRLCPCRPWSSFRGNRYSVPSDPAFAVQALVIVLARRITDPLPAEPT